MKSAATMIGVLSLLLATGCGSIGTDTPFRISFKRQPGGGGMVTLDEDDRGIRSGARRCESSKGCWDGMDERVWSSR